MRVSINELPSNGWLVYHGKSQLEVDENWGYPYFRNPPISLVLSTSQYQTVARVTLKHAGFFDWDDLGGLNFKVGFIE